MIKFLFAGRRAPGRTRAGAQDHLLRRHGRMVVLPPADSGAMPADYVQNHVLDGAYPPGSGPHAIVRDLLTELWFEDLAHLHASTQTDYYRASLGPDEPRFVDDTTVAKMRVIPRTVRDGARGRYKIAWLLTHADGAQDWVVAAAEPVLVAGGFTRIIANTVTQPPAGDRFVDTVIEGWHDDLGVVHATADAAGWPFDDTVDRDRSLTLVLEEFPRDRLRALFA